MAEDLIIDINDEGFDALIKEGITVVDFYAEWCSVCKKLAPVFADVARNFSGKVKFAKLDIEKNQKTAKAYDVTSIPTVILYKDGKEINRTVGLSDENDLKDFTLSA